MAKKASVEKKLSVEEVSGSKAADEMLMPGTGAPPAPPQERMQDQDFQAFEMGKLTAKVALKEAEKALAENKAAELAYKYLVLQLAMKYGLTAADGFDDQGNIHRGVIKQ